MIAAVEGGCWCSNRRNSCSGGNMQYRFIPAVSLMAGLALAGCGRGPDVAAEAEKIRALDQQWVAAVQAKDAAASAGFYAADGALLAANAPMAKGTAAVTAAWQGLLGLKNVNLTFAPTEIVVSGSGDMAYDIGTYALGFDSDNGPVKDEGKYVVVWKKVDGGWKVAADIFNSNGPAK
jgi:uncharacterized protein (TIGR02246 family)